MKIHDLNIGLQVRHPQYGLGVVKALDEHTAEVRFSDVQRTVDPEMSGIMRAEPTVAATGLDVPLKQFVDSLIETTISKLGLEKPDGIVEQLGQRWNGGRIVMHPADPALQAKEVPMETFFHKIVMVRNNLRVLEQKINAHEKLSDGEKFEMQQYITRCYGSFTTFNILFKDKEGQFSSKGE